MFDRPHPTRMQYMSLEPISLALTDKQSQFGKNEVVTDSIDEDEEMEKARSRKLVEKLKWHSVIRHVPSPKEVALPVILNQVNCAFEIGKLIEKNSRLIGTRAKRTMSVSERVVESATTLWDFFVIGVAHVFWQWLWPVITRCFVVGLVCHRAVAEIVLRVLEWRARPDAAALKDISATAQQVDIRLQQFCYWPIQYIKLRQRKDNWESITTSHPDYIRFYNSLWLVANDVIIGIALGSYIIDNAQSVASQIDFIISGWTVEGLQRTISWLMGWPAGLKLNNELAAFLGDLFLWVIEHWAGKGLSVSGDPSVLPNSFSYSLHCKLATVSSSSYIYYRMLQFRRCQHANRALLRPIIGRHHSYLLVLHRLCPNIQLAAEHHHLSVSSFPWEKEERTT
jgi:phosphatidylinositol glycan class Q protein